MGIKVRTFVAGRTGNHIRYFKVVWPGGYTAFPLKLNSTEECVNHIRNGFAYIESITEITRNRYFKIHDTMK